MLEGKGLWAYRRAELDRALQIAPLMGVTHVIYKVGQGSSYYLGSAQAATSIREAGLVPIAWTFLQLDDPQAEAQVAVRAMVDGFDGFVFDVEDACSNRFTQASQLGHYVRGARVDESRLYNCSFPNISHHRDLPYDQMNTFCKGGLMPMAYGTYFSPESETPPEVQAQRVIDEWTYGHYEYWCRRWGIRPPLYPVLGPYHDEHGSVRMTPDELLFWIDRLAAHGPSFFSVFTAAVLGDDLLPLIEACPLGRPARPASAGVQVEVHSPEAGFLNVRATASTHEPPIGRVDHGTLLEALESRASVEAKVGREGQWLRVRTPEGLEGYVAAWYVRLPAGEEEEEEPPVESGVKVEVQSSLVGYLNVRPEPSTARPPIGRVDHGTLLDVLEPRKNVEDKVGQEGQWLRVRTPVGLEGYVAAWYVSLPGVAPDGDGKPVPYVTVRSLVGLNVRPRPGAPPMWRVADGTVLEVRENPKKVARKIGKDEWIKVCTPSLHEGYVSALYVRAEQGKDVRQRVSDSALPAGESAWIYGIHAAGGTTPADFRFLFQDKGKTGWILYTEAIGADADHVGGGDYTSWSQGGYGVIVRLNHGYEPAGTLPVRARYEDFARACAGYVQRSRGCHVWVIGNEQNNVREHPGGAEHPVEHITPQLYAEAFNLARRRIKAVQPDAIVVPGAVDPYNTYPWALAGGARYRPLDYYEEMLAHIVDLDGIALHTYTHWMDTSLITSKNVFGDAFLQPGTPLEHYYDFQAYRPFAEAVPAKWRSRPIYITESNHWVALDRRPRTLQEETQVGWVNRDKGWVRAAYEEIDRWNSTPHAQQIHCLLLYRWTGDAWAIEGLGEIHKDLRKALDEDYRWRR